MKKKERYQWLEDQGVQDPAFTERVLKNLGVTVTTYRLESVAFPVIHSKLGLWECEVPMALIERIAKAGK